MTIANLILRGLKILYVIIFCLLFFSCSSEGNIKNNWIANITEHSAYYIIQDSDTIYNYVLFYDECDTHVINKFISPIIMQWKDSLSYKSTFNTPAIISFHPDSIILKYDNDFEETKSYLLKDLDVDIQDFEKRILSIDNSLSNYFSGIISAQEKRIKELSSRNIELTNEARFVINSLDSLKNLTLNRNLHLEYSTDLCWKRIQLDKICIKPRFLHEGNLNIVDVYNGRDLFQSYTRTLPKNMSSELFENNLFISKFFKEGIERQKMYAFVGEVIVYYNELITKIYLME